MAWHETDTRARQAHNSNGRSPGVKGKPITPGTAITRRPGRQVTVVAARYAAPVGNFAVTLVHAPGWDPSRPIRSQDGWDEHAAFMDGLVADGFLIVGGPLGNGERTLHLVQASGEDEIRARLAEDPWASAGLLRVGAIEPWALWLDGRAR
jgi:uncharacterized protein YciI